jgi:hypothetical protein
MKAKLFLAGLIFLGLWSLFSTVRVFFPRHLSRRYPLTIKTASVKNLITSPLATDDLLKENLLIKDRLGANTYRVLSCYQYRQDNFVPCGPGLLMRWQLAKEILAAKSKGLAVEMMVSWSPGQEVKLKDRIKLEEFLNKYQDLLVKEADFAEKYKVEYFSLNEPDHLILSQDFPYTDEERVRLINGFKERLLPKIRGVYKGKVYYQVGDASEWDFSQLDPAGLDLFGILIGGRCNFAEFKNMVDRVFFRAKTLSQKYNTPWFISELWINKNYQKPAPCNLSGRREIYYRYILEKAKSADNLIGVAVDSWNFDEPNFRASIKDTPAEAAVKSLLEIF